MKLFLAVLFLVLSFAQAYAQTALSSSSGREGEILSRPICSWLTNRSSQTIMGTLATAAQRLPSGDMVKHRDNFRLEAGARKQFCASGPFYEGQRLELILRTLIPLFTCKTKIDKEIFLDAAPDENGIVKLSATCS